MSLKDVELISKDKQNHKIADQLVEYLQTLIRIPSPSGSEGDIADYLVEWIKKHDDWNHNSDDIKDDINNVYFVPIGYENKTLPLLIVHSDTVNEKNHAERLANVEIVNKLAENGCIENTNKIPLGYDDKCGIAIILWLINHRKDLKFRAIVAVQEERCNPSDGKTIDRRNGGCGIQFALENKTKFFNSRWGLLLDRGEDKPDIDNGKTLEIENKIRREKSDIVWKYDGKPICRNEFIIKLEEITENIGTSMQRAASGFKCDAMNIREYQDIEKIDLVNLATGVYREEKKDEYVNIFEVIRTLKVVEECLRRNKELSNLAKAG